MLSVLYVDDEPTLLELGRVYLELSGTLRIDTAISVQEALGKIREQTYDGIISDYEMPGINGLEFLRHVRSHYNDLPFILFTGRGREEIAIEALNSGADFYLQKGGYPRPEFVELEHKLKIAVERKKMRDDLKASRQQMADLIEFLPDATFALNSDNTVISWNRMMERVTGIPAAAVVGTGNYLEPISRIYEGRSPLVESVLAGGNVNALGRERIQVGEKIITEFYSPAAFTGRGAHLWLIASPLYDANGRVIGAIESIRDITDRKKAEENLQRTNEELTAAYEQLAATEEELRRNYEKLSQNRIALAQSEERYRNIVEDQTELICRFLPDGCLTFVNGEYCRYFGLDPKTCLGKQQTVNLPPPDRERMNMHLSTLSPEHPVAVIEHRIIMPDGRITWQRWSDRAVFTPEGRVTEYQSVGRDVTERRHMEQALYEANKKLKQLSSVTRHDILGQLTALHGYLTLLDTAIADPHARSLADRALETAQVIHDQVVFTRQYENVGVQSPCWQNVFTIVTTVCNEGGFPNVMVDESLAGLEIFADPLLNQVFYSLFEHARMQGKPRAKLGVSGSMMPQGAEISIEADGEGIPTGNKQKIFERGAGSHADPGFRLVQQILSITGLTIEASGDEGCRTRFVIHVPAGMCRDALG